MKRFICLHGKPVTDSTLLEKALSPEVPVFETMRAYHGKIFRLDEHLRRMKESAKTTGFSVRVPKRQLDRDIRKSLKTYLEDKRARVKPDSNLSIRLTFVDDQPFVMISERDHPRSLYRRGISLRTSSVKRSLSNASYPEAKSAAYQNSLLPFLDPKGRGTYEWVFLDQDGAVMEVSVGNLFIIRAPNQTRRKPKLLTPPPHGILNGVTRQFVIECALQAGFSFEETTLMRHDIYNADEAFLTNTSWEILPIYELDKRKIGTKVPGSITLKLQRLFKQQVQRECF